MKPPSVNYNYLLKEPIAFMENNKIIQIVLIADTQWVFSVKAENPLSLKDLLEQSHELNALLADQTKIEYACRGRKLTMHDLIEPGSRVEICQPLVIHPRDARRLACAKGEAIGKSVGDI